MKKQKKTEQTIESPSELLKETAVIDGHCDSVLNSMENSEYLSVRNETGHVDAPRMIEGNVSAMFFACWVHPDRTEGQYAQITYQLLDELHTVCEREDNPFQIASTAEEIRANRKNNTLSVIPCVEGGHSICNNVRHLRNFARLNVKYLTLTWMNNNEWADGSGDQPEHGGLTDRGRRIVREMNRLGMIVDVSHASGRTFRNAVEASAYPVIASHSSCRSICDHHRNLSDEQLRMIGESDGVVGICFYPGFLDPEYRDELEKYEQESAEEDWIGQLPEERRPHVGIDRLLEHIDHAVDVAGIEHVGLGSDFDGVAALPEGIDDCSDYPRIASGLLERGYRGSEIRKIFGENFLRVIEATE